MKFLDKWIHKTAETVGGNAVKGASCEVKKIIVDCIPLALMCLSGVVIGKSVFKPVKKENMKSLQSMLPAYSTITINNHYYMIDKTTVEEEKNYEVYSDH